MTIKIYSCAGSRGMRPIWTAEEMGLDYEVEIDNSNNTVFNW